MKNDKIALLLIIPFLNSPNLQALTKEECADMIQNWDVAMDMLLGLNQHYTDGVKVDYFIRQPGDYGVYLHKTERVQLYRQKNPVCRFRHSNFFTADILFSRQWLKWGNLATELKTPDKQLYCHSIKDDTYGTFHVCCLVDKPKIQ